MKRPTRGVCFLLLFVLACSHASSMEDSATQDRFGVRMARMNLWREAMFRFKRAVQLDPASAMAHNNLAVAYEANGDFENALTEYREALRLDRSNQYIQKNYSRFIEFTSRNKKRQQRPEAAAPAPGVFADPAGTQPPTPAPVTPPSSPAPVPPPSPSPTPRPSNPPGE
ncbi:MAG TPA: tetratricopeptide repeat protein [Thermoanaerobaculia bacterium]|nr:tetratricopeptide repeat protein [Thermoanaerobaculia bacterium]